jgi:serpin B
LQILELPYKGEELSMLIILPKQRLSDIDSSLNLEKYNKLVGEMERTSLDSISIPKFEFDTKYFMKETLSELGMPTAFSPSADFSGMTAKNDLMIDEVIHQAYVKVDEEGTEAAAATGVVMKFTSAGPENKKIFNADHPFVFIIQERKTGNILFIGRVIDPTSKQSESSVQSERPSKTNFSCDNLTSFMAENEYISCTEDKDCVPRSCGCVNHKGSEEFAYRSRTCGVGIACLAPPSCDCENSKCIGDWDF